MWLKSLQQASKGVSSKDIEKHLKAKIKKSISSHRSEQHVSFSSSSLSSVECKDFSVSSVFKVLEIKKLYYSNPYITGHGISDFKVLSKMYVPNK